MLNGGPEARLARCDRRKSERRVPVHEDRGLMVGGPMERRTRLRRLMYRRSVFDHR